jgi:hypothetical protein
MAACTMSAAVVGRGVRVKSRGVVYDVVA